MQAKINIIKTQPLTQENATMLFNLVTQVNKLKNKQYNVLSLKEKDLSQTDKSEFKRLFDNYLDAVFSKTLNPTQGESFNVSNTAQAKELNRFLFTHQKVLSQFIAVHDRTTILLSQMHMPHHTEDSNRKPALTQFRELTEHQHVTQSKEPQPITDTPIITNKKAPK